MLLLLVRAMQYLISVLPLTLAEGNKIFSCWYLEPLHSGSVQVPDLFLAPIQQPSSSLCDKQLISRTDSTVLMAVLFLRRHRAVSDYSCLMAQTSRSARQSRKLSQAIRRQAKKLHRALGT